MLARFELRALTVAALQGAVTAAGDRIYVPRDLPTAKDLLPVILVQATHETKESLQVGQPRFKTTVTMRVTGRVGADSAAGVEAALDELGEQIESAILGNVALLRRLEQIASVETEITVSSNAEIHFGDVQLDFAMQTFEDFEPLILDKLANVTVKIDTTRPYDSSGTYPTPTEPGYAPTPAPRTSGPDGRDESVLSIDLPQ